MSEYKVIGQRIPRMDAVEKVRGRALFGADIRLPRELVAKFLPSPYAHAEIISIDTSKAERLAGVRAVITAADIPVVAGYDPNSRFHAFLARHYIVFAGQPIAAVAAEDLATAEAALELIDVKYRSLPVVSTIQQALAPDSTPVAHYSLDAIQTGSGHVQVPAVEIDDREEIISKESPNISETQIYQHGDLEAAFAESDVVVENTYTVPVVHQGYIEPHAVLAHWDKPDHVTVWEGVQGAFAARDLISQTLGIRQTQITLNSTEVGGGFGGKVEGIFAPIPVLLAKKTKRPVRLVVTRHEELIASNPAPHSIIRIKVGACRDGTLTALTAEVLLDAGAFPNGWIMSTIMSMLRNTYKFKAWHLKGTEILTNKASATSYRAPGGPNASFAIESQIDDLAHQLGMDPLELRLKNLVQEGDPLANMEPQVRIGSRQVLEALLKQGHWPGQLLERVGNDGFLHGRGLALGGWEGSNGPASALAILEADGRIRIVLGTVDLTGSFTSMAQIVAEVFSVSVERVVMSKASPDYAPFAPMSAGSQTIYAMGAAVKLAAEDLRGKIIKQAAQILSVDEEVLVIEDSGIYVKSDREKCLSFAQLYLFGTDWFAISGPLIGQGSAPLREKAPSFVASVAEVVIDPETGLVKLTKLATAQDVGKAINPLSVEGQIQGGSTQSVGFALWEEVMYSSEGQVLNPSLLDYRIATSADIPMIEALIVEVAGGDGPFGAKIAGEPSIIPPVAAIANAIAAAIDTRIYDLPITPERVWRTLKSKGIG